MADATIPPPEPDDKLIHLGSLLAVVDHGHGLNRTYVAAVIRRCHAAEAEVDRLRTRLELTLAEASG